MIRPSHALCLLAVLVLALAGCGDSDSASTSTGNGGSKDSTPAPTAESESNDKPKKGAWGVVFGATGADYGLILYDLSGHTLYAFERDRDGKSVCYGACARTWPPALTEDKPRAGGNALPGKVGATKRRDGTRQLTYAGRPLYTYSRDRSAEVNGHGVESFGGEWSALRANGQTAAKS